MSIENHSNVPSVKEVDDLVVVCVGQMGVTVGSDLLWKPLNHEVTKKRPFINLLFSHIGLFHNFHLAISWIKRKIKEDN